MISPNIQIKNNALPNSTGVYLYYNARNELLYIGKATSLKKRVSSYFNKTYVREGDVYATRIGKMVSEIVRIDYIKTPTVIEALVLEANLIRVHKPRYNAQLTDDKSFLYLVFTNEDFPRPLYVRGLELARKGFDPFSRVVANGAKRTTKVIANEAKRSEAIPTLEYIAVYGPFTSPNALRQAMDLLRRAFPWSTCTPPKEGKRKRACFDVHLRKCPGVCTGAISKREYRKQIRNLMQFFDGKKGSIVTRLKREMKTAAAKLEFERAARIKRQIAWLEHIRDISVITRDFSPLPYENPDKGFVDALGRIEAYDISNISGTSAVGSMVVFERGQPKKSVYRKFKIKTVVGANDVAMMREVMERRLARAVRFPNAWPLPDVFVIDGGKPQVNVVLSVLREAQIAIPVIGLAKGHDRKRDELIFDRADREAVRMASAHKETFQRARDEAHRFAVAYHRKRRSMR
ncbi:hypothetical protein A3C17_03800 [Candidatus Uhrbacteria bacterium RIFCSPHIGHO2_02_FULL_53_13]|uniref:Excinuclease ABC subunit C n=2 Tax=Candidatus Uhriibacteriota TaxID=1752732 RepID=A0A1F7TZ81_9BACT|nr:MAG: hypothetical protein A3C17_03800 [Candidatus Uhrbacteria bacterium RIFCSPHIGHO2_02_FULL_53_13]OGL89982.1 MAG: hypothetical protein A3I45_02530 [Candidatus Uhrbacteria bacterium RIFCSPLOWO2_02_FULL_53_10]